MASKQIRVSDNLYARVKSETREGETMGEALERMVGGVSLLDLADGDEYDEETARMMTEATERAAEKDSEEGAEVVDRIDS
jgi:predicted CopG family antitoxin